MMAPKVAAIHDISGFGRCSLTVALPILSAMGNQCCPLPTAFLSAHTGFEHAVMNDMTGMIWPAAEHWKELGIRFDAIYSGFLGSEEQIDIVRRFISEFRNEGTLVLVDPVMGDHGRRYRTYTEKMCAKMGELANEADIITPNLTEAAFLLGLPYDEAPRDRGGIEKWLRLLSGGAGKSVVITGIANGDGAIGACCLDADGGEVSFSFSPCVDAEYSGTGDIFASVLLGERLRGSKLALCLEKAVDFVYRCARYTNNNNGPLREGVIFEPLLGRLSK